MKKKPTAKQFDPNIYPEAWALLFDHQIPEIFLAKIGDFAVSFAILEDVTRDLIRLCITQDERTVQIITAELPFKGVRALVMSLFQEKGKDNEYYIRINELMKRVAFIEEKRNQIIHGSWSLGADGNHITLSKITAKEGRGLVSKQHKVTSEQLSDAVLYIRHLAGDIIHFGHDYATATGQNSLLQFKNEM